MDKIKNKMTDQLELPRIARETFFRVAFIKLYGHSLESIDKLMFSQKIPARLPHEMGIVEIHSKDNLTKYIHDSVNSWAGTEVFSKQ